MRVFKARPPQLAEDGTASTRLDAIVQRSHAEVSFYEPCPEPPTVESIGRQAWTSTQVETADIGA